MREPVNGSDASDTDTDTDCELVDSLTVMDVRFSITAGAKPPNVKTLKDNVVPVFAPVTVNTTWTGNVDRGIYTLSFTACNRNSTGALLKGDSTALAGEILNALFVSTGAVTITDWLD